MAIFLNHSYNVPPSRCGSTADIQHAMKVNSEAIYGLNYEDIVLDMPLFWGLPALDYSMFGSLGNNNGAIYDRNGLVFTVPDYVAIPDRPSLKFGTGEFSIAVRALYVPGGLNLMVGKYGGAGNDYWLGINHIHTLQFSINATGVLSIDALNDGLYHNLLGIRRSGNMYAYSDTKSSAPVVNSSAVNPTGYLGIGKFGSGSGTAYNGHMKIVHMSNIALSEKQISLFNDLPYGLYQSVSMPLHLFSAAPAGWTGKLSGITNPGKINGVSVADIASVMGH